MKKWENNLIQKNYSNKIRNAKPNLKLSKPSTRLPADLRAQISSKSSKSQLEVKKTRMLESAGSNKSSISDYYEFEKTDLINIPLYRLLKLYNLQQYAKQLISRGFGYDLQKFMFLSKKDLDNLMIDIKVMPGHKTKLLKLLDYINSLFISLDYKSPLPMPKTTDLTAEKSNISNIYLKSKSANSLIRKPRFLKRQNSTKEGEKQVIKAKIVGRAQYKLENVGCDFFRDSQDIDDDFSKTLEKIMNKYQSNESVKKSQSQSPPKIFDILKAKTQPERKSFKKIINHGVRAKALDIELITAPKSKLLINLKKTFAKANPSSTKDPFDIGLEYNQIKNLYISFDSGKMTSTLVNLDIEEMTYCLACVMLKFIEFGEVNKGKTPFPPQTNVKNPEENYHLDLDYKPVSSKNNDDSRNFDLSDKIKETPQKNSFGILEKKIKELDKLQKKTESGYYEDEEDFSHCKYESLQRNSDVNNNLKEEYEDLVDEEYYNHLEENDEIEFEQSKKEIESILKESLLVISASKQENNNKNSNNINNNDHKPNFLKNTATFNKNLDSLKEEEKMYFDSNENNETYGDNTENNCFQSRMEDNSKVNISLCSKITYFDDNHPNDLSFSRDLENVFENAFNEKIIEKWTKAKPTKDTISNFCKNIIITSKMEKEVTIICLIYIEKLIIGSGFHVSSLNWRRIVFIALILASKLWDDESYENDNFAQAFPQYTTKEINSIEMVFLKFINYQLYITSSDYAKYYFILRTFAEKNKKSFPLRALDLNTILSLQNNANNAQKTLKELYVNSLNKTF